MLGHPFYQRIISVVTWVPPHIHRPQIFRCLQPGPPPFPCSSMHWTTVFCIENTFVIKSWNRSSLEKIFFKQLHSQSVNARVLKYWVKAHLPPPVTDHVSQATCHISYVTCHVSRVIKQQQASFFQNRLLKWGLTRLVFKQSIIRLIDKVFKYRVIS